MDSASAYVLAVLSAADSMIVGSLRTLAAYSFAPYVKELVQVVVCGLWAILAVVTYAVVCPAKVGDVEPEDDYDEDNAQVRPTSCQFLA
jgi:hypothetical protein